MDTWQRYERDFKTFLKLEKGLADNSVQSYLTDYAHLSRFAQEQGLEPEQVKLEHLQLLIKNLNDMDIAVSTQCRMIWRYGFQATMLIRKFLLAVIVEISKHVVQIYVIKIRMGRINSFIH